MGYLMWYCEVFGSHVDVIASWDVVVKKKTKSVSMSFAVGDSSAKSRNDEV